MEIVASSKEIFIIADTVDLSFLINQLSANVLFTLSQVTPFEYDEEPVLQGPSLYLREFHRKNKRGWANHGYNNAFQKQIELIHAFIESIKTEQDLIRLMNIEPFMPLMALKQYQIAKTNWITKSKEKNGANWGDATGYNNMNWAEHNERILKLMKYPEDHQYYEAVLKEPNPHGRKP